MQQSPSLEASSSSASQEIRRILLKPKVRYRINNSAPTVPILSHIDPVYVSQSHFLKIHFNIILPPTPRSSNWTLSLRFPHQILYASLPSPLRATCTAHRILLDLITRKIFGEQYRS
jgi:hypothetical protein